MSVVYADVVDAAHRLEGVAHRTPVLRSRTLDEMTGAQVWLKCENHQRVGAFKFRGAYNAISRLSEAQKRAGVVAFSSGNHAQAVALACKLLGVEATIVMPEDAPRLKLAATTGYGAEVIRFDRLTEDREAITRRLVETRGAVFIAPFDNPHVIAGQGTAAKELIEDVGELDVLLTPVGGGGLIAGCSIAAKALLPEIEVYGAEPRESNDAQLSLRAGARVLIDHVPDTIADGANLQQVGELTFPIMRRNVSGIVDVGDHELVEAMRFLAERVKTYVEPTGCLPLAAIRRPEVREVIRGKRVGLILSGGNVDAVRFGELVAEGSPGR